MNARFSVLSLLAIASVALPTPARAYRPFASTDAEVAENGEFELELGPVEYIHEGATSALFAPSVVANLGFAPRWEAVLQARELVLLDGDPGENRVQLVETAALLKAVLREGCLQDQSGPSIGTEFGVLLPTVNAEPGAGVVATLLLSQRFPVGTVHVN